MQNAGFLFVIKPFLDKLYADDKDERKKALMRHLCFFNTQPYMSSAIVAIVINAEKSAVQKTDKEKHYINTLKTSLSGPLSAIGDGFFWGTLRPFVAFLSIFIAILFQNPVMDGIKNYNFIVPVFFLLVYNVAHLFSRIWLLAKSLQLDKGIIAVISNLKFRRFWSFINLVGFLASVVSLVLYIRLYGFSIKLWHYPVYDSAFPDALIHGVMLLASVVLLEKVKATVLFYFMISLCVMVSYSGM
jgi:PTS system mannose-specific IID component